MADTEQPDLTTLTVDLLSAYFASNSIESESLAGLIKSTHDTLKALNAPPAPVDTTPEHVPAVSVRKSLSSPDHILSLIDGKPYKTLKRHLGTHGLTPAEYRERYKLPRDYPLVAKTYSEHRRKVAAELGLGRNVKGSASAAAATPAVEDTPVAPASEKKTVAAKAKSSPAPKAQSAPAPKAKAPASKSSKSAPAVASVAAPETVAPKPSAPKKAAAKAPVAVEEKPAAKKPAARKPKLSIASPKSDPSAS